MLGLSPNHGRKRLTRVSPPGHVQSRVVAGQTSPPSPLSLNGRGGAERILMKKLPSPREGEGQGVRGPDLTLLMPWSHPFISTATASESGIMRNLPVKGWGVRVR